jgi:hypothetical protein
MIFTMNMLEARVLRIFASTTVTIKLRRRRVGVAMTALPDAEWRGAPRLQPKNAPSKSQLKHRSV